MPWETLRTSRWTTCPQEEGYMMVYTANQTNEDLNVYFDDMAVTHTSGPIIRTDDYYPFGMTFNTSVLDGALTNKYLFNGIEHQPDLGLNTYQTIFRTYDPVLGRFLQIDPLADFMPGINPYSFGFDNPVNLADPDGLGPLDWLIGTKDERRRRRMQRRNSAASNGRRRRQERKRWVYGTTGSKSNQAKNDDDRLPVLSINVNNLLGSEMPSYLSDFEDLLENRSASITSNSENERIPFPLGEGGRKVIVTDETHPMLPANSNSPDDIYPYFRKTYLTPIANTLIKYPTLKLIIVPMFINLSDIRKDANTTPELKTRATAIMRALIGMGVNPDQLGKYYGEYLPESTKGKVIYEPIKFIYEKK